MIEERGGYLHPDRPLHPGRPDAATFACGTPRLGVDPVHQVRRRRRRSIWGSYAGLLGYFGGKTFKDSPFKGFLVAFAIALALTGGVELVRWLRKREPRSPEARRLRRRIELRT